MTKGPTAVTDQDSPRYTKYSSSGFYHLLFSRTSGRQLPTNYRSIDLGTLRIRCLQQSVDGLCWSVISKVLSIPVYIWTAHVWTGSSYELYAHITAHHNTLLRYGYLNLGSRLQREYYYTAALRTAPFQVHLGIDAFDSGVPKNMLHIDMNLSAREAGFLARPMSCMDIMVCA